MQRLIITILQLLQKAKYPCSGFSKDEELKDVEQKPLTNEDKLDLLLAQMMEKLPVKSSEKVTQVHKQTQNVDENISQESGK